MPLRPPPILRARGKIPGDGEDSGPCRAFLQWSLEWPQLTKRAQALDVSATWGHCSGLKSPKLVESGLVLRLGATVVSSTVPKDPDMGRSEELGSLEWPQLSRRSQSRRPAGQSRRRWKGGARHRSARAPAEGKACEAEPYPLIFSRSSLEKPKRKVTTAATTMEITMPMRALITFSWPPCR